MEQGKSLSLTKANNENSLGSAKHCHTCRCRGLSDDQLQKKSCCISPLLSCCCGHDKYTMSSAPDDEKKSRWLNGPPPKNPFKRDTDLKKSVSASSVGKSLKKSVSSSSLGKTLKKAASRLSLSSSRGRSASTVSVNTAKLLAAPDNEAPPPRSRSSNSVGSIEIGEAVRTRFIWDHGGSIVYVCVMQNGIKKSYRLLKENEGYHAANATLWAGRCEFRYIVDNVWTHDKDLPAVRNEQDHYNNQIRIKKGPDGMMLIKNPREENLIAARGKKQATAEIHEPPKASEEEEKAKPNFELRKCLSGDDTLMLSLVEGTNVNTFDDTLVLSCGAREEEASDDELDEELPMEEIGSPPPESAFLTEISNSRPMSRRQQNPFEDDYEEASVSVAEKLPDLEVIQTQVFSNNRPGLLESHFDFDPEELAVERLEESKVKADVFEVAVRQNLTEDADQKLIDTVTSEFLKSSHICEPNDIQVATEAKVKAPVEIIISEASTQDDATTVECDTLLAEPTTLSKGTSIESHDPEIASGNLLLSDAENIANTQDTSFKTTISTEIRQGEIEVNAALNSSDDGNGAKSGDTNSIIGEMQETAKDFNDDVSETISNNEKKANKMVNLQAATDTHDDNKADDLIIISEDGSVAKSEIPAGDENVIKETQDTTAVINDDNICETIHGKKEAEKKANEMVNLQEATDTSENNICETITNFACDAANKESANIVVEKNQTSAISEERASAPLEVTVSSHKESGEELQRPDKSNENMGIAAENEKEQKAAETTLDLLPDNAENMASMQSTSFEKPISTEIHQSEIKADDLINISDDGSIKKSDITTPILMLQGEILQANPGMKSDKDGNVSGSEIPAGDENIITETQDTTAVSNDNISETIHGRNEADKKANEMVNLEEATDTSENNICETSTNFACDATNHESANIVVDKNQTSAISEEKAPAPLEVTVSSHKESGEEQQCTENLALSGENEEKKAIKDDNEQAATLNRENTFDSATAVSSLTEGAQIATSDANDAAELKNGEIHDAKPESESDVAKTCLPSSEGGNACKLLENSQENVTESRMQQGESQVLVHNEHLNSEQNLICSEKAMKNGEIESTQVSQDDDAAQKTNIPDDRQLANDSSLLPQLAEQFANSQENGANQDASTEVGESSNETPSIPNEELKHDLNSSDDNEGRREQMHEQSAEKEKSDPLTGESNEQKNASNAGNDLIDFQDNAEEQTETTKGQSAEENTVTDEPDTKVPDMGGVAGKPEAKSPPEVKKFITPKHEVVNTTPKKDIFKEVNNEIASIQKSQSRSSLALQNELQKSASKSRFLEDVKKKKELEQQKEALARIERAESQAKTEMEMNEKKRQDRERKSSVVRKPINEFDEVPKKLDEIFGPVRDAPATFSSSVYVDPDFDPGQKDISGINETVRLKKSSKPEAKPEPKKDKFKYELPSKPAKFPKAKPKEPTPPPVKEATPPKEPSPEPVAVPDPPKDPTPERSPSPPPLEESHPDPAPQESEVTEEYVKISPTKILPPKIGINGFNGVGRLVLRAAIESGLEVKAINDPFVPLHYMVYMLKFDIANSNSKYHEKEMVVRESPTGQLVVNGKAIVVYAEHDVTKIPWDLAGVNYVVEATEALNTKAEAGLHLKKSKKGTRMRHILEMECNDGSDPYAMMHGGCKKVVIAGPSPDAPLLVIGLNDDLIDPVSTSVISHASAQASALSPVLSVLHKKFVIKSCSYTILRSIRGRSKDSVKCANVGPSSHSRSVKWDFTENLVPTQSPSFDEEMLRILPFLHKKFKGICVYVPTPEVSMIDVTLQLENDNGESLYRDVCLALKEASEEPPLKTVLRYCMKMSDDNSASSLFASETHSSVVDAKSGCQINHDTIKLVIWFDNETGHAYRIVDLITNFHIHYDSSE